MRQSTAFLFVFIIFFQFQLIESYAQGVPISKWEITPEALSGNQLSDKVGQNHATYKGSVYTVTSNKQSVIEMDGSENSFPITDNLKNATLPTEAISVTAIVNLKKVQDYSGILGAFQDNGGYEKGWLLAFEGKHLTFGLSTVGVDDGDGHMTYLNSTHPVETGKWLFVTAVYDGQTMSLYINGKLDRTSTTQKGDILYPPKGFFELGAYRDDNENYKLQGSVRQVTLYGSALSELDVQREWGSAQKLIEVLPSLEMTDAFLVAPYLQWVDSTHMRIIFETHKPTQATVQFGEEIPFEFSTSDNRQSTYHDIQLVNLKPRTNYFYKVILTDSEGSTVLSDALTFQTSFLGNQPVSIGIVGDTQNNPDLIRNQFARLYAERPHFVLHAGDIVGNGNKKYEWTNEYLNSARVLMERMPVFAVPGNHDEDADYYYQYLSAPDKRYYRTFQWGAVQVFMIDSNHDLSEGSEQYKWLKRDLEQSTASWKIAIFHHPPFSSDENDYGNTHIGKSTYGQREFDPLIQLFEDHQLDVVINGHIHTYERTFPLRNKKIDIENGITYLIMGGAGGGLEDFAPTKTWFSARVQRKHHYGMVMIYQNTLELNVFDSEGHLFDHHIIQKNQPKRRKQ